MTQQKTMYLLLMETYSDIITRGIPDTVIAATTIRESLDAHYDDLDLRSVVIEIEACYYDLRQKKMNHTQKTLRQTVFYTFLSFTLRLIQEYWT